MLAAPYEIGFMTNKKKNMNVCLQNSGINPSPSSGYIRINGALGNNK